MNSPNPAADFGQRSVDVYVDTIRMLQGQLRDLSSQLAEQREAHAARAGDEGLRALDLHRLLDQIEEAKSTGARYAELNRAARVRIEELESQLALMRERQALAEVGLARLRQIERSRSWALTSPLRQLAHLVRSLWLAIRGWFTRSLEAAYRAVPPKLARKIKGGIFRATGPAFSGTRAYRRWQAAVSMHASLPAQAALATVASPPSPVLLPPEAPASPGVDTGSVAMPGNPLWVADGHREWADYAVVRARIDDAEAANKRERPEPLPFKMLDFSNMPAAKAASAIRLPLPPPQPKVTILVPVYNHLTTTLECLASIAEHADPMGPSFEVLVANDASTDETSIVLGAIANLRTVTQSANLGFLRNCNEAAPAARGEYLLLLNNDVQVRPGWLSALVACIEASPDVGAVGPRIVYPSGWLQEAGTALHRDGTAEMIGLNQVPDLPQYSYSRDVDYCSGACLLLLRRDFEALGGFDLRYVPAYCEDSDLCMRLRSQGKRIVYCADATVLHHLSRTSDTLDRDYKLSCIAANLETFAQRWRPQLDQLDDVRTIAFYLPQFHPIPENDLWWGQGFTEWTNVTRARPNYVGHYQPRVPADLGYYDLRLTDVLEQQAELARRYGIGGFCFYYYWFAGKRLLERPIEQMLATGRPSFPFCLCWANENWTRRWDGQDQDVLMAQRHSPEDDRAVIMDLIRYFRSPDYIRVHGKPLVLVYRVTLFPDFASTARLWREVCREQGIGEIYIAQVESFELVSARIRPEDLGCDAAVEFPPQGMADPYPVTAPLLNASFNGAVADYRDLAVRYATRELPPYKRFMGVMPGWDNTARRQDNSYSFEHATPGAFQAWLETAIARTKQQYSGDERLIFVNAWNEWAEGAYLEPDRRFGHGFLEAHANAKERGLLRHGGYSLG